MTTTGTYFRTGARGLGLAALLLLGACGQGVRPGADAAATGLCLPFKEAAAAAPAGDSSALDECLHRWGYALAESQEHAELVAQATQTACAGQLSAWNQKSLAQAGQTDTQAVDLVSGQPTDALSAHAQFAQSQALLYVMQARAGHCAPPSGRLLTRTSP
jgi:hypothetical protein